MSELTQEEQNKLFKHIADTHIDLANAQLEAADLHIVSSGFLYGSARFTAFTVANNSKTKQEYEAAIDGAVDHYTNLFKSMLQENIESYKSAFKDNAPRYGHLVKEKK